MSYLIFWSKGCPNCAQFLNTLDKMKENQFFKRISVDKINGQRPRIVTDYGIKAVPTIVVDQRMYVGVKAFEWLKDRIRYSNKEVASISTRQNKIQVSANISDLNYTALGSFGSGDGSAAGCSQYMGPIEGDSTCGVFGQSQTITGFQNVDDNANVEKTPFILTNTGLGEHAGVALDGTPLLGANSGRGNSNSLPSIKDKPSDKTIMMESQMAKLANDRKKLDDHFQKQQRRF